MICFISHSWGDGEHSFAKRLRDSLIQDNQGAWLDEDQIDGGQDWDYRIRAGVIYECDVFLFVLSPAFLASQPCKLELSVALSCQRTKCLQIIPLLLKTCEIPKVPPFFWLKSILYEDFRDEVQYDKRIKHLLRSTRAAAQIREFAEQATIGGAVKARRDAVRALANKHNPNTVPFLIHRLAQELDPEVRYWIALALGQIGTNQAVRALWEARQREADQFVLLGIDDGLKEASWCFKTEYAEGGSP